ncbi:MAG: GldG family protein, partial [Gammaproteobacteria bacterium]|nr:GldG family protein [Gammaproteobacteria bacterium]
MKKFELNKRTLFSSTGLLITLAALLIINILASLLFSSARLDLTENKLYTLSDGTKNILKKIDEPITLRLYFSESVLVSVPGIMTYGQRVKELLQEYENYADGNVNLIIADPEPFSDEEDQAVQYGLQGVPLDAGGTQAYFGLVGTNAVDDEEVIAFFQPNKEQSLEYDITKLVNKLMSPKQKVVGLMSSLPLISAAPQMPFAQNGPSGDWTIVTQLKQFFKVEPLQIDTESIPDNIDVLMLVHPKTLSDKTQYAIDQFVLNGGRAIVFVDPHSEADEPPGRDPQNPFANMNVPRNSSLDKLFAAWGIELSDGLVALDRRAATRVNAMVGRRPQPIDYVAWLTLDKTNFSDSDFVTSELKNLAMGTVGVLKKVDEATTEFTPLLKT